MSAIGPTSCKKHDPEVSKKYVAALAAYDRNDLDVALTGVHQIQSIDRDHPGAKLLEGKIAYYSRGYADAEKIFRGLHDADSANVNAAVWLAKTLWAQADRTDDASNLIDQVLEKDHDHIEAWYLKGLLSERKNDLQTAMACYRTAARQGGKLALIHKRLGELYADAAMKDESEREFNLVRALTGERSALARSLPASPHKE